MLTIFVRHTKRCLQGGLQSKGLNETELRLYKHCACPKWYSGTHNGRWHPRQTLNANTWAEAERKLKAITEGEEEKSSVTIKAAIDDWMVEVHNNGIAPNTDRSWTGIGKKFTDYCASRKVTHVTDVTPKLINEWRASWATEPIFKGKRIGIKPNTQRLRLTILRMFWRFVRRQKWIKENPMEFVHVTRKKRGERSKLHSATMPVDLDGTDKNYQNLLKAILGQCNGEYLHAITELMYNTGLRSGDAIQFDPDRVIERPGDWGEYTTLQMKTEAPVTVGIPPSVWAELKGLPKRGTHSLFLADNQRLRSFYSNHLYKPLARAGVSAGISNMHPHRLRDSFAVNRLNEGMLMEEVSLLLGHANIGMTEQYYAPFVKSRKETLLERRRATDGATAKPKVIRFKKPA